MIRQIIFLSLVHFSVIWILRLNAIVISIFIFYFSVTFLDCILWSCFKLNSLIFRLNSIRHLRIDSIFSMVSPIFYFTLRFIQSDRYIFRYMISRNKKIYTTNCNFFNSLIFIIDGNSYTILNRVFIYIYNPLSNHYLYLFGFKSNNFDFHEQPLTTLQFNLYRESARID